MFIHHRRGPGRTAMRFEQERYPEGHPKGGQFKPKGGGDDDSKSKSQQPKGEPDYDVPPHMTSDEYYGTGEHANKPGGMKPGQVAPAMTDAEYKRFVETKNVSNMSQFDPLRTHEAMKGYELQEVRWAVQRLYLKAKTPRDFQQAAENLVQTIEGHIAQVEAGQADPYAGLSPDDQQRIQSMDPAGRQEAAMDVHRKYLQKAQERENTVRNTITQAANGFINVSWVGVPSEESRAAVARVDAYDDRVSQTPANDPNVLASDYEQEITGDRD